MRVLLNMSHAASRGIRNLCCVVGCALLIVSFTPVVSWLARPLVTSWTGVDHGVLIMLSGTSVAYEGPHPSTLIGLNTYWRTVHAIAIWRQGHFRKLLVSGRGTAESVKPILLGAGIPAEAIVIENESESTRENAAFAKQFLLGDPGPYVLLTSDYHMLRASRAFARQGIRVETMPAPDLFRRSARVAERWDAFQTLLAEYASIARYRLQGWI